MSVQLNTGIHLFLQEPLLQTLLISGEVGTGKTYALLQALHDRGRTYTTITSHTDVSAMQEAVDIQRTLDTAQIVKQAHPWDGDDLLTLTGPCGYGFFTSNIGDTKRGGHYKLLGPIRE